MKNFYLSFLFVFLICSSNFFSQTKKISFLVNGMCGMCEERIENALDVKGISFASWSEETKVCNVTFNTQKITEKKIHELLAQEGHDTPLSRATDEAYNNLHHCCRYVRKDTLQ